MSIDEARSGAVCARARVHRRFGAGRSAVPEARRFVRSVLADAGLASWPAELLVSEVVTNVVLHADTAFEVRMTIGGRLRIEVLDGSATLPAQRAATDDALDGRGLLLLDALALRWGVDVAERGKAVWFELPAEARQHDRRQRA